MIALSYSRLSDYRQCPRKFFLKYIEKAPNFIEDSSSNPHLVRGSNVHKALEMYVVKKKSGQTEIPPSSLPEVERTKPLINNLMANFEIYPEMQIAINKDFKQVDWFSKEAWFRVIVDILGFGKQLFFGDYKTGKVTDYSGTMEKPGQLHLSSLVGMALWPTYEEIINIYLYVDHMKKVDLRLTRDSYEPLKKKLIEEHDQVNSETAFCETQNEFCKWCAATKDQCVYSRNIVIRG